MIPLPDPCSDRMRQVIELVLGKHKSYNFAAGTLNLSKGQVARCILDYWAWRKDGTIRTPKVYKETKQTYPQGNVKPKVQERRERTYVRAKVLSAEEILPPTKEEIYRTWANQVIMASRGYLVNYGDA